MPEIPKSVQPRPGDVSYDLDRALSAIVSVRTQIPDDAMTAQMLGTERVGHGAVIRDDGLILTIGYLVTEARTIWLIDGAGKATEGHALAYDQETGFALVQALGKLDLPALPLGSAPKIAVNVWLGSATT